MEPNPAKPRSFWSRLADGLDLFRNIVVNSLFVLLLIIFVAVLFSGPSRPQVPRSAALVFNPEGAVVEEFSTPSSVTDLLAGGQTTGEVRLADLLTAIDRATEDDRIKLLVLKLDKLVGARAAHLQVIGDRLEQFKATGKPIWAVGNYYDQNDYYLASFATTVYMHPMGEVMLKGYGTYQPFLQTLLEKLRVNVHVFRVGTYKSAVEPFTRSSMSEDAKVANQTLVDGLWTRYRETIASNRSLSTEHVQRYADQFDEVLQAAKGETGRAALEQHLVDELLTTDETLVRLGNEVGVDDTGYFNGIGVVDYLNATRDAPQPSVAAKIAVIEAEGNIVMGEAPRRSIGASTLSELIRQARDDETVQALVLRIDSPGGSAFASELIRQELELMQISGRPVVISMGAAAASGGYWIAATADHIVANRATVTGSIGIFGIIPTFEESLDAVGVHFDGVGTTAFSDGLSPTRPLNEPMSRVLQANVEAGYKRFINLVARGRDLTPEAVDAIAQGRVWLGEQALELGLVDELGNLDLAIERAAGLAQLERYQLVRVQRPVSAREQLLRRLGQNLGLAEAAERSLVDRALRQVETALGSFAWLNDPKGAYALCEACTGLRPGF